MSMAALNHWEVTRDGLHQAAQIVGAIRKAFIPPQPNALHLSLFVVPQGLSTGSLPVGTFTLNFGAAAIDFHTHDGHGVRVPLANHTPKMLPMLLMQEIAKARPDLTLRITPKTNDLTTPFRVDPSLGAEYASVLYTTFTAMARFRARLKGMMTPLVVWPHHFDLSMLWFSGTGSDEHTDPHINLGFAPFSDGFPRPYIYAYAWPTPRGTTNTLLPSPARWHRASWNGVVIDYDVLRTDLKPEEPPAFKIE